MQHLEFSGAVRHISGCLEYAYISVIFGYRFRKNSDLFTSFRKIKTITDICKGPFTINKSLVPYLFYHGGRAPSFPGPPHFRRFPQTNHSL